MVSRNEVSTESKGMHIHKNSKPTSFKVLQRETSVYEFFVELKEDVITEQGFLDLAKVPRLFVLGAGQFLKKLRLANRLKRKDIANILGIRRLDSVTEWENNRKRISLNSLIKIVETLGISKESIYSLIDQGKVRLRQARLPVRFELILPIIHYFTPQSGRSSNVTVHKCSMKTLAKIEEVLNVKPKVYPKRFEAIIFSSELKYFLTTFFRYTKVPKLHFPLAPEVEGCHFDGVDLKRAIIIPCLQSDGTMSTKYNSIRFCGFNKNLHDYFVDAMYYEYGLLPTTYFSRFKIGSRKYITSYSKESLKEIVAELMNIAGNTKTKPANGQTVNEYLKEPQPHMNYLINASRNEQQIALRAWMSTEGSVAFVQYKNGYFRPRLSIACAHPILAKQLQHIAKQNGIHFYILNDKRTWSGIGYLDTQSLQGYIKFLKFGGFIKGVKISANSTYHEGVDKDVLMLGILEYIQQKMTTNKWPKKLPMAVHHHNINEIIKNGEYKSNDYYLNHFSLEDDDTML